MASEQKVNLEFVLEVEKYPCLYNYKLPDYVRKDIVDKAWFQIGQKFNLTGAECKERWRNIRNVFVRNLKPGKNGCGTKKKKPYYLNEVMQFTLPFIKLTNVSVSDNAPTPMNTNDTEDSEKENSTFSFGQQTTASQFQTSTGSQITNIQHNHYTPSQSQPLPTPSSLLLSPPVSLPTPSQSELEPAPSLLTPSPLSLPTPSDSSLTLSKKKDRNIKNSLDEEILEYLKAKQARKETSQHLEQQPKKMFLLSLLPDLESMSDRQMRVFKTRVMHVIEDILEDRSSTSSIDNPQVDFYYESKPQINNIQNTDIDNA